MSAKMGQIIESVSWDWCIRYLKNFYPQQSWSLWTKELNWGYWHDELRPPFVLRRIDGEFCLCHKLDEHYIYVSHPVEGQKSYLKTTWLHLFKNEVIRHQHAVEYHLNLPILRQILCGFAQFLWQKPKRFINLCTLFLTYELLSLFEPFGLSLLIEHADLFAGDMDMAFVVLLLFCGMSMVWSLSYFRQKMSLSVFGQNAYYFSIFVWLRYFSSSLSDISKQHIGDVYPRLFSLDQISYRLLQQFVYLSFDALFMGLNLLVLACINIKLACIDLASFILIAMLSRFALQAYQRSSSEVLGLQQSLQSSSLEVLQQLPVTRLWQQEHVIFGRWKAKTKRYWQAFLKNELQQFKLEWLIDGIKKFNILLVLALAIYLIRQQQLSMGFLIAYLSLKMQIFARFEAMVRRLNQAQYLKAPLEKLMLLFQKLSDRKKNTALQPEGSHYNLSIEQIHFSSQGFKNLYFTWGKNYLIDGPSGRGKTSLLKAIVGLSSPMHARIFYQGLDCELDDFRALHTDMAIVLAEHGLWQGSLMDNISMFEARPNIEYIKCLLADLLIDIDLQTIIGKSTQSVSSGQMQKILLARALYRRPKWLILDEATCHLDEKTERDILKKLLDYPCSLIVVNHRQHVANFFHERIMWDSLLLNIN